MSDGLNEFWLALLTAGALVLVIEGLLYALFAEKMRNMLLSMSEMGPVFLRRAGLIMAAVGVFLVWLIRG